MSGPRGDVAIIGMACIFPGAADLRSYWQNIVSKVDAVTDPPDGWGAELFYDPASQDPDRIYCKRGGYLKDLASFEPIKYGVMPNSVAGGEPEHFLALRVAHEALGDAGYLNRPTNRMRVEVILGMGTVISPGNTNLLQHGLVVEQTLQILKQLHPEYTHEELQAIKRALKASLPPFNAEVIPGLIPNIVAGRIANRLDLMGPNYIVDAACASSLIAVEHGLHDLLMRKCDLAIVGGVHVSTPPPVLMGFCQLNALSPKDQIRPFDKDADGTLLGEGLGMVVLKCREDAERDGDRIYAVIKGVGTASDGRALGLLAPRVEGEELALRRAYEATGLSPRTVGLIEAHGTGTPVGDLTEIHALRRVFGDRQGTSPRCALGSVKSMISHLMPAAGIAGLIKAALALYHKVLPPSLHCDEPNPKLELERTPFYINTETRPWIHGGPEPRRAGVNAFGFGGINAHAILEESTGSAEEASVPLVHRWDSEVCILQEDTRAGLISRAGQLLRFLSRRPPIDLEDLAYTLNCPLQRGGARLAIVATSLRDLEEKATVALQRLRDPRCQRIKDRNGIFFFEEPLGQDGTLAFLFPGQGSQYVNMLADVCLHFPEVRRCFDHTDRVFRAASRDVLPSQVLFPTASSRPVPQEEMSEHELSQVGLAVATVMTANRALFDLLDRLEIRPAAMAGHSSGELAALLASGALDIRDEDQLLQHGLTLNRTYESLANRVPPARLMTVGAADPAVVAAVVAEANGDLHVTMDNCPHQVILCGTEEGVDRTRERLQALGAICTLLPFERAYHSHLFRPICDQFAPFFDRLSIVPPRIRLYSCATTRPYPKEPAGIRQLAAEQLARPVRFRETIEAMYADGVRIFVEVGPRGNLTSFVDDILRDRSYLAAPSNLPGRSGIMQLNFLVGLLAAHGIPMRLDELYARRAPRRVSLEPAGHPVEGLGNQQPPIRLALELPRMRLERAGMPSKSPGPPMSETPPAPHRTPARDKAAGGILPRPTGRATAPSSRRPRLDQRTSPLMAPENVAVPAGPPDGPRAQVMHEYLQTMERFLTIQQEAVAAFAARRRPQAPTHLPRQEAQGPFGPFRLTAASLLPGKEVRASCEFDLEEHLFLRNHTLGKPPSVLDETLHGLPTVPLTFSLEIMAQIASVLFPGWKVLGVRAVRVHRWFVVERRRLRLLLTARQKVARTTAEVEVAVFEGNGPGSPGDAQDRPLVEGTVILGTVYPPPDPIAPFTLRAERAYRFAREQYYTEVMFHGPLLQNVVSINRVGEDGIETTLQVLPATGLFRSQKDPGLLTDPVLLDGAVQSVGFWAWDRFEEGFVIFPVGVEAFSFYGPWPQASESLKCSVRIMLSDVDRIRATIDVVAPGGRLVARAVGCEYKRFYWSRQFCLSGLLPRQVMLSTPWPSPLKGFPSTVSFRSCRISESGDGIWLRAMAYFVLNRRERKIWSQLTGPERRRKEWLLGRLAAKDAVRLFLKDRGQTELAPADIEILSDEHGCPGVAEQFMERAGCRISLSIAHASGVVVAIAGDINGHRGVGIDVEPVDGNHEGLERVALTVDEQALLAVLRPSEKEEWLLRLWCAKEAVAKAIGRGMVTGPLGLVVHRLDMDTGQVTVGLTGELARQLPASAGNLFTAHTGREEHFIFASSLA